MMAAEALVVKETALARTGSRTFTVNFWFMLDGVKGVPGLDVSDIRATMVGPRGGHLSRRWRSNR